MQQFYKKQYWKFRFHALEIFLPIYAWRKVSSDIITPKPGEDNKQNQNLITLNRTQVLPIFFLS